LACAGGHDDGHGGGDEDGEVGADDTGCALSVSSVSLTLTVVVAGLAVQMLGRQ